NERFYLVNTCYIIPTEDKFLLGILNSSLIQFIYAKISSSIRGGYLRFIKQYLEVLPIKANKSFEKRIFNEVEMMLQLQKEKQQTTLPDKLNQLETRIQYTDDKINKLVYELYGLNEEEVGIVEGTI
ncbi:MAG: TaqI-like C-terminal specificity domain-containing protein, partial [Ginsengibacter sp.]